MIRPFAAIAAVSLLACGSPPDRVGGECCEAPDFDAAAPRPDADPNAPDANPNAPDANPNAPDAQPSDPDAAIGSGGPIDLLFVVDDSGGMTEEQNALFSSMPGFIEGLRAAGGDQLPGLHIGVVSTNLGAGPFAISGCAGGGDGAVLQNAPTSAGCSTPSDRYIVDEPDGVGGRTRNYSGTLAETISCIGRLGQFGCGFEQPLEAMRRALDGSVAENAGFLRDEALLVVVILTNEDDCSAEDVAMFDPSNPALGPLSSFRCFEYGVACTPDEPRTPGVKTGCASREDSLYIFPVQGYVDFLHGLKPAGRVIVAGLTAAPSPVEVGTTGGMGGNPELLPACTTGTTGDADPAVRIDMLLGDFGADGVFGNLCDEDMAAKLSALATRIGTKL